MPINAQPLAEQVYTLVLEEIRAGKRAAGERISEESISADFGISRTPAREALMRLAADGLIDRQARKGCRIALVDHEQLRDLQECRAQLESLALRQGIAHLPAEKLDHIEQELDRAHAQADGHAALAADGQLHELIAATCPNRTLAGIVMQLITKCQVARAFRSVATDPTTVWQERKALIAAMRRGEHEEACRLLTEHIMHGAPE